MRNEYRVYSTVKYFELTYYSSVYKCTMLVIILRILLYGPRPVHLYRVLYSTVLQKARQKVRELYSWATDATVRVQY